MRSVRLHSDASVDSIRRGTHKFSLEANQSPADTRGCEHLVMEMEMKRIRNSNRSLYEACARGNQISRSRRLTWIEDDDRLETRQLRLIDVESLYLQTQLGHDAIEYLHNARLDRHVAAECVVGSEAHLLRLD